MKTYSLRFGVWFRNSLPIPRSSLVRPGQPPLPNWQNEKANQSLESAYNVSLPVIPPPKVPSCHSTGMSLFLASLGYQPLLFEVQKEKVAVPSRPTALLNPLASGSGCLPSLLPAIPEAEQVSMSPSPSLSAGPEGLVVI